MRRNDEARLANLGDLQREIVQVVWANAPVTAETVREKLSRPLKESTVRTVLRRCGDTSKPFAAALPITIG